MPESALVREDIEVAATAEQLGAIHAVIDSFLSRMGSSAPPAPEETWRLQFVTAVGEIAGNIIQHAYATLAEPGRMTMKLYAFADRVEAEFYDEGKLYEDRPQPKDQSRITPLNISEVDESGRGLAIARAWVDRLDYRRTASGNIWHLVKRR